MTRKNFARSSFAAGLLAASLFFTGSAWAAGCSSMLYGSDMLGRTYNVKTGKVANANSVTNRQLFDLQCQSTNTVTLYGTSYQFPSVLTLIPSAQTTAGDSLQSSYSYKEINKNFGVDLGVSGISSTFSAELNASIALSSSKAVSTSYIQANAGSILTSYRMSLPPASDLRNLLLPEVRTDIDTMEANALVAKYGTHFLNSSVFGGRWLFTQSISRSQAATSQSVEASVQANYKAYSANVDAGASTQTYDSATQTSAIFTAIGGAPIAGKTTLDQWAATIPGNFGLIDFDRTSGTASLLPLSVLAVTPQRVADINQAIVAALSTPQYSFYDLNWDNSGVPTTIGGEKGYQLTDVNKIIVGIALNIQDGNVTHMGVQTRDLNTGEIMWIDVEGRSFNLNSYEIAYSLENTGKGLAAVGYCFSNSKNNASGAGFYYRSINATSDQSGYLQNNVALGWAGTPSCEASFNPGNSATKVLVGIGVRAGPDHPNEIYANFAPLKAVPKPTTAN